MFRNSNITDITEQKSTEQNQIDQLNNLPFGTALYEYDGEHLKALHINCQYQLMVGREYNSENPDGFSPIDFIYPDDRGIAIAAVKEAIAIRRDASCDLRVLFGESEYHSFHLDV